MLLRNKPKLNIISIVFLIATLSIISLSLDISVAYFIKFSIYLILILLLCANYTNTSDRIVFPFLIAFSIGLLLSNTLSFIAPEILMNAGWYKGITIRVVGIDLVRGTGLMYDPNFQGQAIALSVSMIICNMKLSTIKKTSLTIIIFSLLLFGYITLSKSYFISSLLIWVQLILVFLSNTSRIRKWNLSFVFYIFVVVFIVFFSLLVFWQEVSLMFGAFWRAMSSRIYDSDFSTGRFDIQSIYLERLGDSELFNILFGFGLGINERLMRITGVHNAPHNSFLESFSYLGIFGTISLIVFLMSCYANIGSKNKTSPNQRYQKILLLSIVFVYLLSLDMLLINLSVFYVFLLLVTFKKA
jgi:hypothetical protein